jgi:hypothetical protein
MLNVKSIEFHGFLKALLRSALTRDSIYVVIGYFVTHVVGRTLLITQVVCVLITDTTFCVLGEART